LIVYKIYSKEIEEMQEELNEKVKKYGEKKWDTKKKIIQNYYIDV
jgi:hypothetical protein